MRDCALRHISSEITKKIYEQFNQNTAFNIAFCSEEEAKHTADI